MRGAYLHTCSPAGVEAGVTVSAGVQGRLWAPSSAGSHAKWLGNFFSPFMGKNTDYLGGRERSVGSWWTAVMNG